MKKYVIIILLIFCLSHLWAQDKISKSKLKSGDWRKHPYSTWVYLFKDASIVQIEYTGIEEGATWNGLYEIRNNIIYFRKLKIDRKQSTGGVSVAIPTNCEYERVHDSLFFTEQLLCEPEYVYISNYKTFVPPGSNRKINRTSVIVIKKTNLKTKAITPIYSKPNSKSKLQKLGFLNFPKVPKYIKHLPKGYSFTLIARTAEKSKIRHSLDYWYYVTFRSLKDVYGPAIEYERKYGWIFGSYLKIKD